LRDIGMTDADAERHRAFDQPDPLFHPRL
jgi:hypothetical protein